MPELLSEPDLDFYPSSDGQPMGETWIHVYAIMMLHQALEDYFKDRSDTLIASDMFWYWEKGNKKASIAPDVMVVLGLENPDPPSRRSYFSWKERGRVPSVVFEMASENTYEDDLDEKLTTYERLGVPEYFLFDPEAHYLRPPLQGFRLRGKSYRRIPSKAMESRLGFRLKADGQTLRLIDAKTGKVIPTRAEAVEQQKAKTSDVLRLVDVEKRVAEAEMQRAESEKLRAESERQRADLLAAEVERLKKQLGGSGS